ncbi:MAG: DNA-binding response regulator [Chloroflexi bacterium]|nr:DNA-binding response regulator [Chloroflexota bacterium]
MTGASALDRGRHSFRRNEWESAYADLSAADRDGRLRAEDLEWLASAAYLTGRDAECAEIWARAHRAYMERNEIERAARCGFWLGLVLLFKGEVARSGGWLSRSRDLIEQGQRDCVERGYLLVPAAIRRLDEGDAARAYATFSQVARIGDRFQDRDLMTLGRLGRGQSLVRMGKAGGVPLLDEAMVAVTSGEVSAIVSGIVYCAVIEACLEIFDLPRAQEWTNALSRWCDAQPDLVPYRGQCMVRRAEIMQLRGAWEDAIEEARRACEWLSEPRDPAVGAAYYRRAELHRLRGEFAEAEGAYRQASRWGRAPEPGLPLLRLAQDQVDAARAAIRRAAGEVQDRTARSRILAASVEISLVAGDVPAARAAATELAEFAAGFEALFLDAVSAQATGAVHSAEGNPRDALITLRQAWTAWQKLEAPYEAARVRLLIGLACRQLGDEDGAEMEFDAARRVFARLGAAPDLARVKALSRKGTGRAPGGLTAREVEVLRLVAAGKTNREIASTLVISERTVARHVQNIFARLGVGSRSAATAYAFKQHVI